MNTNDIKYFIKNGLAVLKLIVETTLQYRNHTTGEWWLPLYFLVHFAYLLVVSAPAVLLRLPWRRQRQ